MVNRSRVPAYPIPQTLAQGFEYHKPQYGWLACGSVVRIFPLERSTKDECHDGRFIHVIQVIKYIESRLASNPARNV